MAQWVWRRQHLVLTWSIVSGLEGEGSKVIALSFRYSWPNEGPLLSIAIPLKSRCHFIFAFCHPLPAPNLPGLPQPTRARLGHGQVCAPGGVCVCVSWRVGAQTETLTTSAPRGRCTPLDLLQVVFFVIICCCFKKILTKVVCFFFLIMCDAFCSHFGWCVSTKLDP